MTLAEVFDVLLFRAGFNTAVVLAGAAMLGAGAGLIGVFVLLRRRALVSDAISHATLPGVALGFLAAVGLGLDGRNLPILLVGAASTGILGILAVQWIRDRTRLPEDAAIGTVLSVFFGAGIVLLSHIQTLAVGGQAGLDTFLIGQAAAMSRADALLIGGAAALVVLIALAAFKEFALVCFDPDFAGAGGWRVGRIDLVMLALLLAVVVIGLKTVGLILIIALVIVPPVAARFWTERLNRMALAAALFGAASGYLGAAASALLPRLPAGGVIVLVAGALFVVSLLFAPARGVLAGAVRRLRFRMAIARRQGLLAVAGGEAIADPIARLVLRRNGLIDRQDRPTESGRTAAAAARREQRLWRRYRADYPTDAIADREWSLAPIDAVLPADLVAELERRVAAS
ncbi:MAG: metal ABC transporter permease [Inquilinus sp.]|nr:metal ABC transporter permease [Inquilinus sp.]